MPSIKMIQKWAPFAMQCYAGEKRTEMAIFHINADFGWSTHIDQLSIELKKRVGLLRRIRKRVPKEKIVIIAEGFFNSLLRYGVAVFLKPIYDKEDLNMEKNPKKYCYPSNTTEQYAKGDLWL